MYILYWSLLLLLFFIKTQYCSIVEDNTAIESIENNENNENVESIKHTLPNLENKITFNKFYILAEQVMTPDIISQIHKIYERCFDANHTEDRYFGGSDYGYDQGHVVIFLDDCMPENIYNFFKLILFEMLSYMNHSIINYDNQLAETQLNSEYQLTDSEFNVVCDWKELVSIASDLESRCIEYIVYDDDGHLGWHTDDDSNFTMVALLNSDEEFHGGLLQFREEQVDDDVYEIKLLENEVIMFPSFTEHAVTPVADGVRIILVIEWWNIGRSMKIGRWDPEDHFEHLMEDDMKNGLENEMKNDL